MSAPKEFHCKVCKNLPVDARQTACNHFYCCKCLDSLLVDDGKGKCLTCSKVVKKGKKVPQYEQMLREAFPEEYEARSKKQSTKLNATGMIKLYNESILGLIHARDRMFSRIRSSDIKKQAEEFFGTARKYSYMMVDVPWEYQNQQFNGGIKDKYSQMTDEEICALPVEGLCRDNCMLLFWTTLPKLQVALSVMHAWGFEPSTAFVVWSKLYPKSYELASGSGCYTRPNSEICLLGIKGDMSKFRMRDTCTTNAVVTRPEPNPMFFEPDDPIFSDPNKRLLGHHEEDEIAFWESISITSPLFTARRDHSEKPEECYEKALTVFGDLPRYDMFARKRRAGWDSFGDQLDKFAPDVPIDPKHDRLWKERQDRNAEFEEAFLPTLADRWKTRVTEEVNFT